MKFEACFADADLHAVLEPWLNIAKKAALMKHQQLGSNVGL